MDACVLDKPGYLVAPKSPITDDASFDFFGGVCDEDVDPFVPCVLDLNDSESKSEEEENLTHRPGSEHFGDVVAHELDDVRHGGKRLS